MLILYRLNLQKFKQGGDDAGGDDAYRKEREERWEVRKPQQIRDATLDSVIRQAYDKAMGREVSKPIKVIAIDAFDHESDDEDVLLLMMG